MNFVAPWMLLGLFAGLLPLIIHLIGRRRAPKLRFAAIDFIFRSNKKLARRFRVRQQLLLITRMILAAGLGLLMAKPFVQVASDMPSVIGGAATVVVIVDDSLSMRRVVGGTPLFEQAKKRAAQLVDSLGAGVEVALLSLSQPAGPRVQPSADRQGVHLALASMRVGYAHARLKDALARATTIQGQAGANRYIFFLSDMAGHNFDAGTLDLPGAIRFHAIPIGDGVDWANYAVSSLTARPSTAPGQRSTEIVARVCNYSAVAAKRGIRLEIAGEIVARGVAELPAARCVEKVFQHTFARSGLHDAAVVLQADTLEVDDRRSTRIEVQSDIRVLMVNGAPSSVRFRDELFYLEMALVNAPQSGQPISVDRVIESELSRTRLANYDVVALCNLREVDRNQAAKLLSYVEAGGGLLITLGDQTDREKTNRSMGALLPQPLRGVISASAPGTSTSALHFGQVDGAHPLVASIWSQKNHGLTAANFWRVYRLQPSNRPGRQVLVSFDDGTPALVEARLGKGRSLLFTSTIDRDWTDLPIRPGFLPLIQQLTKYLAHVPLERRDRTTLVGSQRYFRPPPGTKEVIVSLPGGQERSLKAPFGLQVDLPGQYAVQAVMEDGERMPLSRESFAANVDTRESNLEIRREIQKISGGSKENGKVKATRRVELWHAAGLALLFFLFVESWITRK